MTTSQDLRSERSLIRVRYARRRIHPHWGRRLRPGRTRCAARVVSRQPPALAGRLTARRTQDRTATRQLPTSRQPTLGPQGEKT